MASNDLAYLVGERLFGNKKTPDGRWAWKSLTKSTAGPIDTTGPQPKPWTSGLQIIVPPNFTADLGAKPGANGAITGGSYYDPTNPPFPGTFDPANPPSPMPGIPFPGQPQTPPPPKPKNISENVSGEDELDSDELDGDGDEAEDGVELGTV